MNKKKPRRKTEQCLKEKFMQIAVGEAIKGVEKEDGGPFGAVIVKGNKVVAKAHNMVLALNDPTAHAEILAIRKASAKLARFNLGDCEIYSTCEPCPMCLSAIYWARIRKTYLGCSKRDAEKIGFDDNLFYSILRGEKKNLFLKISKIGRKECLAVFKKWFTRQNKISY
jgi:guanine deaminase